MPSRKIVVINLPYRVDRRRETEAELRKAGFPEVKFFPAIRPESPGPFGSIGERGAFLSHQAVLASANGSDMLVLEDDVSFAARYEELDQLINGLPPDWGFFYLGHMQLPECKTEWHEEGIVEVNGNVEFIGTHCYAVSSSAVGTILSALDVFLSRPRGHPDGGPMPVDGAFNIARRQTGLRTFAMIPAVARQRSSRTDIAPLKWFDRVPVAQQAANALRWLKNARSRGST